MNKKNITLTIILIIIILIISIAIFYPSKDTSIVKIGYLDITASLPLFIAEEKGFIDDYKIEYETIPLSTSNQLVDAVIADNIDLYIESSAVPVLAVELQAPGKIKVFSVSEITRQHPFDAILTLNNSSINQISDLPGKKIGVFPGSTATTLLRKYLQDSGINTDEILFVPIIPPNQLTALYRGSIDALHAYEPTIAIAKTREDVKLIHGSVYAEMISPNPQGVAVVSSKFVDESPKIANSVIEALEKAMLFMKDNDFESRKILSERMKLSESIANQTVFLYMIPHSEIDTDIFQDYSDMLTELGELESKVTVKDLLYK